MPSLCIVICIHNAPDYTDLCIASVLKHTHHPYALILVDDGSDAPTARIAEHYAQSHEHIQLIRHDTARGYTAAANVGLRASDADYTVLLNSDTLTSPGWAQKLIACAMSDARIGIVGPLSNAATYQSVPHVFEHDGTWKQNRLPANVTVAAYSQMIERHTLRLYPRVPVANGFCFCIKRDVIDAVGYLDEATFPQGYGEENDYCLRAADAGFTIAIADDAYVYHATSQSFGVRARKHLTRKAHHAIRAKYSEARLVQVDHAWRTQPDMARIREHLHALTIHHGAPANTPPARSHMRILFLLPSGHAASGGAQMVVEMARGLSQLGAHVEVALTYADRYAFEHAYPKDAHLFVFYQHERELLAIARHCDHAIATIFHSTRQLKRIIRAHPHVRPAYFVQDYEPYFMQHYPAMHRLAQRSYAMIDGNMLFAISPWVCDMVAKKHGVAVHKIWGAVDVKLFRPSEAAPPSSALRISAMVRPSTPWRAPQRTIDTLNHLARQHGQTLQLRIFGCSDDALHHASLSLEDGITNMGCLSREEVAQHLAQSDIFLDLSDFQAFGRTALEAMACGCAVVAPAEGGAHDFGVHEENILLIDTSHTSACIHAANRLIDDATLRHRIRQHALERGQSYTIHRCAHSLLQLLEG